MQALNDGKHRSALPGVGEFVRVHRRKLEAGDAGVGESSSSAGTAAAAAADSAADSAATADSTAAATADSTAAATADSTAAATAADSTAATRATDPTRCATAGASINPTIEVFADGGQTSSEEEEDRTRADD